MIIKKYEAIGLTRFSTFVIINGKRVDLEFTPGILYYNKCASITVKDKSVQDALEATEMFKQGRLKLVSTIEKLEPPKEVKIVKADEVVNAEAVSNNGNLEFKDLKALQVYLMKNHKISFSEIRSRENTLAKAEELGLEVKITNN